jgi:hypothetical protein
MKKGFKDLKVGDAVYLCGKNVFYKHILKRVTIKNGYIELTYYMQYSYSSSLYVPVNKGKASSIKISCGTLYISKRAFRRNLLKNIEIMINGED